MYEMYLVNGFNYKINNIVAGLMIRVPLIGKLLGKLLIPTIREMFQGISTRDTYINELIQAKKLELKNSQGATDDDHRDLTTLLLKCIDQNKRPVFTDNQIRAQLFTFLFAGFETTSVAIQAVLFHLGNEPQWVEKICQEFEVTQVTETLLDFGHLEFVPSHKSDYVEAHANNNCLYKRINSTG